MPTFKGFVTALAVRDDGWVETELMAPHAGNARHTFYIRDLDGDPGAANRRLAQTGLLRDAMARSQSVEIAYRADNEQGDLIDDVQIHPRASLAGVAFGRRVRGVVIGLAATEVGPTSGTSPYVDPPDLGAVTLLADDGSIVHATIDLQRPDPGTMQQVMGLLRVAHRTRRPIALILGGGGAGDVTHGVATNVAMVKSSAQNAQVIGCEFEDVPVAELTEVYAFVERLEQRYESYDAGAAVELSHVRVRYTTAPAQTPEGDVSDNGTFAPTTATALVHGDSPLLTRLDGALRDGLMVRLGLMDGFIHEVVVVAHMGSAARPVWIETHCRALPPPGDASACENVPTIALPGGAAFDALPSAYAWTGDGYFNEGVWRFAIVSATDAGLTIDGKTPCCSDEAAGECAPAPCPGEAREGPRMYHAYLCGMHRIEIRLCGRTCSAPFELRVYRLR